MPIDVLNIEAAVIERVATSVEGQSYAVILQKYGLACRQVGQYLQVGELKLIQGWVLHISVILPQLENLLHTIVPTLEKEHVVFRIIKDLDAAYSNLNGQCGASELGKIVALYPEDLHQAFALIDTLQPLSQNFCGPAVPTDAALGANLYTRYGCHRGIEIKNDTGKSEFHIYGQNNTLIPDIQYIPFVLPQGLSWPFGDRGNPISKPQSPTMNRRYKPLKTIKEDCKGNVVKALYFNEFIIIIKHCIIKQGKAYMLADDSCRDVRTRLAWQKELYEDLIGIVPLPKIIDFFRVRDDDYLVMEFIRGSELFEHINTLNYRGQAWLQLPHATRQTIFEFIFQLLDIAGRLHGQGIIHRDITPVNFLVRKDNKLVLIDMELAYSIRKRKPAPPFGQGTVGFMSPEQVRADLPSPKEDIYGLAATLITLFTGLPPGSFRSTDSLLKDNLEFFLGYRVLATTLAACLSCKPEERPELSQLTLNIEGYQKQVGTDKLSCFQNKRSAVHVNRTIDDAIRGLVTEPMPINQGLWYSHTAASDGIAYSQIRSFSKSVGLAEGIAGPLYLLARAKSVGIDIAPCRQAYETNWRYLTQQLGNQNSILAPGLYGGQAGIALALSAGMDAGLLPVNQNNRERVQSCLINGSAECNLANGIAGIGIAAIQAARYLPNDFLHEITRNHIIQLNYSRQRRGYWAYLQQGHRKRLPTLSLGYGNGGIIWYLMELSQKTAHKDAANLAREMLAIYPIQGQTLAKAIRTKGFRQALNQSPVTDTITGILLVLLKAYETFDDHIYRKVAETILLALPETLIHENYTQQCGLAGLGEIYLEAFKIFGNTLYLERAKWISNLFVHTAVEGLHGSRHWLINNSIYPTADFLTGSSGILHFLIRTLNPINLAYRILA